MLKTQKVFIVEAATTTTTVEAKDIENLRSSTLPLSAPDP